MFVEQLDWLATNPRYTLRFALHVGLLCRDMPNTAVAAIEHLHHSTVKDLDKRYTQQQLARAGTPAPRAIGVDEIAIRKGHTYRIVVSDLERADLVRRAGASRRALRPVLCRAGCHFERWRESLKWQRLKPYEKFAAMIERHWDGVAAYWKPKNKVSLGVVEGLNSQIRVLQRRAYGYRARST